jgi:ubiquitin-protein ligase
MGPKAHKKAKENNIFGASSTGDTALFNAIDLAADTLEKWSQEYRDAKQDTVSLDAPLLRIFVLSDGVDTKSNVLPWRVARRLLSSSITLDAVHVGDCAMDTNLHRLAKCTGGYVFKPSSIHSAVRLHELEVVLHGPERPPLANKLSAVRSEVDLRRFGPDSHRADCADETAVPVRRQPPQLMRRAVTLESAFEALASGLETVGVVASATANVSSPDRETVGARTAANVDAGHAPAQNSANNARQRRLLREMRALMRKSHPNFDVYPCETDIGFWRLVLSMDQAPDMYTPYAGGCWLLYILFPPEYPERPPEVRFVTTIRPCNVNAHGRICHSIFDRNYTTDTSVTDILSSVYALVLTPDADDAVDTTLAFQCHEDLGGPGRRLDDVYIYIYIYLYIYIYIYIYIYMYI